MDGTTELYSQWVAAAKKRGKTVKMDEGTFAKKLSADPKFGEWVQSEIAAADVKKKDSAAQRQYEQTSSDGSLSSPSAEKKVDKNEQLKSNITNATKQAIEKDNAAKEAEAESKKTLSEQDFNQLNRNLTGSGQKKGEVSDYGVEIVAESPMAPEDDKSISKVFDPQPTATTKDTDGGDKSNFLLDAQRSIQEAEKLRLSDKAKWEKEQAKKIEAVSGEIGLMALSGIKKPAYLQAQKDARSVSALPDNDQKTAGILRAQIEDTKADIDAIENGTFKSNVITNPEFQLSLKKQQLSQLENQYGLLMKKAKIANSKEYFTFIDTDTFEEVPMAKVGEDIPKMRDKFVKEFGMGNSSMAGEFAGKTYEELTEDQKRVIDVAFNSKYISKEGLGLFLASNNYDRSMGGVKNAINQFAKSGALVGSDMFTSMAALGEIDKDVMQNVYDKVRYGLITKAEFQNQMSEINQYYQGISSNGRLVTQQLLPGVTPIAQSVDSLGNPSYTYSTDQVARMLSNMPTYEEIVRGEPSPFATPDMPSIGGAIGKVMTSYAESVKTNPELKESFAYSKVPQALGSSFAFLIAGLATRGIGLPAALGSAMAGGLAMAKSQYDDAIRNGATPDKAIASWAGGYAMGTTEAVPIENMLKRMGGVVGWDMVNKMIQSGTEEAIQESFQTLGTETLAKYLYDETRDIDAALGTEVPMVAFVSGVLTAGFMNLASRPDYMKLPEATRKALETSFNALNKLTKNKIESKVKIDAEVGADKTGSKQADAAEAGAGTKAEPVKEGVEAEPIVPDAEAGEQAEPIAGADEKKAEGTDNVDVKPTPNKVKVLGKEVNMYNDYVPSKEDVEPDAMYSFNADSKENIPPLLQGVAYANQREVNGVKSENWHASISGDELLKLYEGADEKGVKEDVESLEKARKEELDKEISSIRHYRKQETEGELDWMRERAKEFSSDPRKGLENIVSLYEEALAESKEEKAKGEAKDDYDWVAHHEGMLADAKEDLRKFDEINAKYDAKIAAAKADEKGTPEVDAVERPVAEIEALKDVESTAKALEDEKKNIAIDDSGQAKGGYVDLVDTIESKNKKDSVSTPSKIPFLPSVLKLFHVTRNADKILKEKSFGGRERNVDSPIDGVYLTDDSRWSDTKEGEGSRFGTGKEKLSVEVENNGLVYFDTIEEFMQFLDKNGIPSNGSSIEKEKLDVLRNKGIKGILLKTDFASQTGNELIVIDESIIKSINKSTENEEYTELPKSYYNKSPKAISEEYHKAKADGSNPELVAAVEEVLGVKPEGGVGGDVDLSKPQKFTLNRANKDLPQAPEISKENIDWEASGLSEDTDITKVKLLEARGKNADGQNVGTIFVQTKDGNETYEVKFKTPKAEEKKGEKVEPIRQLGTGANVYFESGKVRVNDHTKSGKVLLNIEDIDTDMLAESIEFDNASDAVKIAERINKDYPNGIPDAVLIDKYVEGLKKELLPKVTPVKVNGVNAIDENGDITAEFTDKIEGLKKSNDKEGLNEIYSSVKILLNGVAQSKGDKTVAALEKIKVDLQVFAKAEKKKSPLAPFTKKKEFKPKTRLSKEDLGVEDRGGAINALNSNWKKITGVKVDGKNVVISFSAKKVEDRSRTIVTNSAKEAQEVADNLQTWWQHRNEVGQKASAAAKKRGGFIAPQYVRDYEPADARGIALKYIATGGRLRGKDIVHYSGIQDKEISVGVKSNSVVAIDKVAESLMENYNVDEKELIEELAMVAAFGVAAARDEIKNILQNSGQSVEELDTSDAAYVAYLSDRSIEEIAEAMDVIRHEIGQAEFDKWSAHVDQYDTIEEALENAPAEQEVLIKLLKLFDEKQQDEIAQREEQEGDDGFGYDDQEGEQDGTGEAGADNGVERARTNVQSAEQEVTRLTTLLEKQKKALAKDLEADQFGMFDPGVEQKIFDDRAEINKMVVETSRLLDDAKKKLTAAKEALQRAEDAVGQRDMFDAEEEIPFSRGKSPASAKRISAGKKAVARLQRAFPNIRVNVLGGQAFLDKVKEALMPKFMVSGYHGSPFDFDRFSTDKIGTGEGAQAFGWGLYFANIKSIAENYAQALADIKIDNVDYNSLEGKYKIALSDVKTYGSVDAVIKKEQKIIDELQNEDRQDLLEIAEISKSKIKWLNENRNNIQKNRYLYEVSLHKGKTPDQYTWLEWDKPVSESQRDAIIEQAKKEGIYNDLIQNVSQRALTESYDGSFWYRNISSSLGGDRLYNDKEASLFLLRAGIDGVKYPAESIATGATSDTARGFNYVVFDENAITIENKVKFSIIGEKGAAKLENAEMVLANLSVAKEMEAAGKDAKTIHLATSWEKGVDGLWRFEIPDAELIEKESLWDRLTAERNDIIYNKANGKSINELKKENSPIIQKFLQLEKEFNEAEKKQKTLGDVIKGELIKAYPKLRDIKVVFGVNIDMDGSTKGMWSKDENTIYMLSPENDLKPNSEAYSTLLHEIQHAIQNIEGFAKGGNVEEMATQAILSKNGFKDKEELLQKINELTDKIKKTTVDKLPEGYSIEWSSTFGEYGLKDPDGAFVKQQTWGKTKKEALSNSLIYLTGKAHVKLIADRHKLMSYDFNEAYDLYRALAGEVEARNVQTRMNMTFAERKAKMLSETEDVARDQQTIIRNAIDQAMSASNPNKALELDIVNAKSGKMFVVKYLDKVLASFESREDAEMFMEVNEAPKKIGTQSSIDITPDMRAQVKKGLPLFNKAGDQILGFFDENTGEITLNEDVFDEFVALEEFGHLWTKLLELTNKPLYKAGIKLAIQHPMFAEINADAAYEHIWGNDEAVANEVLAKTIAGKGLEKLDATRLQRMKDWLKNFWQAVKEMLVKMGLKTSAGININTVTLNKLVDAAARELLSTTPITTISSEAIANLSKDGMIIGDSISSTIKKGVLSKPQQGSIARGVSSVRRSIPLIKKRNLYAHMGAGEDALLTKEKITAELNGNLVKLEFAVNHFRASLREYLKEWSVGKGSKAQEAERIAKLLNDWLHGEANMNELPSVFHEAMIDMHILRDELTDQLSKLRIAFGDDIVFGINDDLEFYLDANFKTLDDIKKGITRMDRQIEAERIAISKLKGEALEAKYNEIRDDIDKMMPEMKAMALRNIESLIKLKEWELAKDRSPELHRELVSILDKLENGIGTITPIKRPRKKVSEAEKKTNKEIKEARERLDDIMEQLAGKMPTGEELDLMEQIHSAMDVLETEGDRPMTEFEFNKFVQRWAIRRHGYKKKLELEKKANLAVKEVKFTRTLDDKGFDLEFIHANGTKTSFDNIPNREVAILFGDKALDNMILTEGGAGYHRMPKPEILLNNKLFARMMQNRGKYVNRSYKMHDRSDWAEIWKTRLSPTDIANAQEFIRAKLESTNITRISVKKTGDGGYSVRYINENGRESTKSYKLFDLNDLKKELGGLIDSKDIRIMNGKLKSEDSIVHRLEKTTGPQSFILFRATPDEIEKAMDLLVTVDGADAIMRGAGVGGFDSGIFKERQDIPEVLRKLMGEYDDPITNYVKTIAKMAYAVQQGQMIRDFLENGGPWVSKTYSDTHPIKVSKDRYSMIPKGEENNYYITKEADQLLKGVENQFAKAAPLYVGLMGAAKLSHTILYPDSQARNFWGAGLNFFATGSANIQDIPLAMQIASQGMYGREQGGVLFSGPLTALAGISMAGNKHKFGYDPKNKQLQDLYIRATEAGVLGESIGANLIRGRQKALEGRKGYAAYIKATAPMVKAYELSDNVFKITQWLNEMVVLRKAYPEATQKWIDIEAGKRVRNETPTYSRLPAWTQLWSTNLPVGSFVSWPTAMIITRAEIFRQATEDISSGNKVLVAHGIAKMAGLIGSMLLAAALSSAAMYLYDWDEEEDKKVSDLSPDFAKNNIRIYLNQDKVNTEFIDLTFVDPSSMFYRPVIAWMREPDGGAAKPLAAMKDLANPYFSTDMFIQSTFEAFAGVDAYGDRVWEVADSESEKRTKSFLHVGETLVPQFISTAGRVSDATQNAMWEAGWLDKPANDPDNKYETYREMNEIANWLLGAKSRTINMQKGAAASMSYNSNLAYSAARLYRDERPHSKYDQYEYTNEKVKMYFENAVRSYNAMKVLYLGNGMSEEEARAQLWKLMTQEKISEVVKLGIQSGITPELNKIKTAPSTFYLPTEE